MLPTQKELLEAHRQELDKRFNTKYPNGKFTLQCRGVGSDFYRGEPYFLLHWVNR